MGTCLQRQHVQNRPLPGDDPGAKESSLRARRLAHSAHSTTQPSHFGWLGQEHSPCCPGKHFPSDKSSLFLSTFSPTPVLATAGLSPGEGETMSRSHCVTQPDRGGWRDPDSSAPRGRDTNPKRKMQEGRVALSHSAPCRSPPSPWDGLLGGVASSAGHGTELRFRR